jgi:hypothetical protein
MTAGRRSGTLSKVIDDFIDTIFTILHKDLGLTNKSA